MCSDYQIESIGVRDMRIDAGQTETDRVDPDEGDDGLGIDEDDDTDEVILSPEEIAAILEDAAAYESDMANDYPWPEPCAA